MTRRIRILVAIIVLATIALAAGAPATGLGPRALAADPPPANDDFNSAQEISPYDSPASPPMTSDEMTAGATLEAGETAPCASIGATVWYLYQPAHDQTVEIGTAGSSFDTVLAVYTMDAWYPSPPGGGLHAVACNASGTASGVTLVAKGLTRYYIQVGGKDGSTGALHLDARCIPGCRPANDDFRDATWAYLDARSPSPLFTETTKFATLEPGEPQPCGNIGATVWFQIYPQSKSDITIETAGSDFDTVLAVYGLPPVIYPSPPGTLSSFACDNGGSGRKARLNVHGTPSSPIYVQVGGANGATGSLVMTVACDPGCVPANDDIAGATDYSVPMADIVHTQAATTEAGEPAPCGPIGRTVWYLVHLPANATIAVDTSGSNFDTVVAAYSVTSGPAGYIPALNLACSAGNAGERARIEFSASADQPYLVQVGGRDGASGELDISISCLPAACPPYNDLMTHPGIVYSGGSEALDTSGATVDPGEPQPCGELAATVWYEVPGFQGGRLRVDASASDYPATIVVYRRTVEAAPPEGFVEVACSNVVEFDIADQSVYGQYRVQVGSRSGKGGMLRIRADCVSDCPTLGGPPPPSIANTGPGSVIIAGPNTGSGGYLPGAR